MKTPKCLGLFLILSAGLALSACNAVTTTKPVGEQTSVLKPEDWDGVWVDEAGQSDPMTVKTVAGDKGELEIIGFDVADGKYQIKVNQAYALESDGWLFLNARDEDSKTGERYLWGRVKKAGDNLILVFIPDPDKFKKLVQDGKLPGTIEKNDVRLGELTADQLKALRDETWGVPFLWDQPIVYRRVTNKIP